MSNYFHYFIFPVKTNSERVPEKNFREVYAPGYGKAPLFTILPSKIHRVCKEYNIPHLIVMDTDSDKVKEWCRIANPTDQVVFESIDRPKELCTNQSGGNLLLRKAVERLNLKDTPFITPASRSSTILWQCFCTTPFLSKKTIYWTIRLVESQFNFDSVLTVKKEQGFFWNSQGYPIGGYRPEIMLPTQHTRPIYKEIHGMFGIKYKAFERFGCRTGESPLFSVVPEEEAVDIDWEKDWKKAVDFGVSNSTGSLTDTKESRVSLQKAIGRIWEEVAAGIRSKLAAKPTPQTGDPNDPR